MVTDLKNSINALKTKITHTRFYFENVLSQLESCYVLIMAIFIEFQVDNLEIQNCKDMINAIPAFPAGFLNDWPLHRANANKVVSVPTHIILQLKFPVLSIIPFFQQF
jgi:hypothetical protein